jgi:hypothetical protein
MSDRPSSAAAPAIEPIRVREYPPFAMAMGMTFLAWLTGSITYDCLFGKFPDIFLSIIFGLVFLGAFITALYSWNNVLALHRIGLYMDETGVTHIWAGVLGVHVHSRAWEEVSDIQLEKDRLTFVCTGEKEPMLVLISGMLENPGWILERAKAWTEAVKNKDREDKTARELSQLQAEFAGLVCQSCGGGVDIRLGGGEEAKCGFCGETQGLSPKIKEAVKRLAAVIKELPTAHRQFQERTLRRFIENGRKYRRTMLGVGWGTASIWLIAVLAGIIVYLTKEKSTNFDYLFLGLMFGLAVLSVATAYLIDYFIRKVSGTFSLPMRALAPAAPGGEARCRLCGAELPGKEILRRCEYCGTDSAATGDRLAEAERMTQQAIEQARHELSQSTESAGRLLDSAANKMLFFNYTQLFWLHIPIIVALDGSLGMLFRLTGIFLAMLLGNLASTILGIKSLKKNINSRKNP